MAFTKKEGRRELLVAEAVVVLADLTSGVALPLIDIPAGSVIDECYITLEEVFNSTTSDVVVIGDDGDTDRFVASVDIHTGAALAKKVMAASGGGYKYATKNTIDAIWTSGGGTPSTGRFRIVCKYYNPDAEKHVQRI